MNTDKLERHSVLELDVTYRGVVGIRVADHHIIHPISVPIAPLGSIVTLNALERKITNLHVPNLETITT
jgi:hypothetical protein